MTVFIKNPNLPDSRVEKVICGSKDELILDFFEKNNITVMASGKNKDIDPAVAEHADMAVLHLGGNKIILDKEQKSLKRILNENNFEVYETANAIKGEYPCDIKLNFTLVGDCAVGNFNYADENLIKFLSAKKKINVKQGYCKCSVLVVDENAVVTDDESICRKMLENGFDVLLISKGDITLSGHNYGFIGGASGKISKDTVLFFGDITKHKDFKKINDFLEKHRCRFICTDNSPLRDIGGIIPVSESEQIP